MSTNNLTYQGGDIRLKAPDTNDPYGLALGWVYQQVFGRVWIISATKLDTEADSVISEIILGSFFCLSLIRNELFLNEQCFPRKRNPEIENSKILPAFEFHRLSGQNETSNWPPLAIIQIEKFRTPHSQKKSELVIHLSASSKKQLTLRRRFCNLAVELSRFSCY